jgi:excisionase family DNA binding protein
MVKFFRLAFQQAISTLGDLDRDLAHLLAKYTLTEAARLLGISRSTVYQWIKHIRETLENGGFTRRRRGHLAPSTQNSAGANAA